MLTRSVSNTVLKNIIVAIKPSNEVGFNIVLLMIEKVGGINPDGIEYTTHVHNVEEDTIESGRYHDNIISAVKDFENRGL